MRLSLGLAVCIGGVALLSITACQPSTPAEIKGTVQEKEYHPAKPGTEKKTCSRTAAKKGKPSKETCSTTVTGAKAECYELEILTEDGDEVEDCNKAAYSVLDVGDPYDSTQDYNREDQ